MSYAGPRGEKHYRLYEMASHPFIPTFVSDPGRERRNKGECGGMEVEVAESGGIERHNKARQKEKLGLPAFDKQLKFGWDSL